MRYDIDDALKMSQDVLVSCISDVDVMIAEENWSIIWKVYHDYHDSKLHLVHSWDHVWGEDIKISNHHLGIWQMNKHQCCQWKDKNTHSISHLGSKGSANSLILRTVFIPSCKI